MKVNIIAGFLGSGKTTLIQRSLENLGYSEKVAVLVNEFGKVGVDGTLIKRDHIDVIEMPQGCICCSLRSGLLNGILEISRDIGPERLIIEPSGIASPSEVLSVLRDPSLLSIVEVESLTAVVDSSNFLKCLSDLGDYYQYTLEAAQIVILNKVDLINDEELKEIKGLLERLNPEAKILTAIYADIPFHEIFSSQALPLNSSFKPIHHLNFQSFSKVDKENYYEAETIANFFRDLGNGQFGNIIRAKGIFKTKEGGIQVERVFNQMVINPIDAKDSRWSIIGTEINEQLIQEGLAMCRLP